MIVAAHAPRTPVACSLLPSNGQIYSPNLVNLAWRLSASSAAPHIVPVERTCGRPSGA